MHWVVRPFDKKLLSHLKARFLSTNITDFESCFPIFFNVGHAGDWRLAVDALIGQDET